MTVSEKVNMLFSILGAQASHGTYLNSLLGVGYLAVEPRLLGEGLPRDFTVNHRLYLQT
jgi:hypothetical protein